jgi:nitrogen regulatory protein P-II 1
MDIFSAIERLFLRLSFDRIETIDWTLPLALVTLLFTDGRCEKVGKAMKKLEAIIQPFMLDEVTQALNDIGIANMTISDVRGHSRRRGPKKVYRGQEYSANLLPKIKIEMVVPLERLEDVVSAVRGAARSGKIGNGKIFISDIADAVRIRTGDRGEFAL